MDEINSMNIYYVYILECSDKSFYTGLTTNLERRLFEHNNRRKGAKYTLAHQPVKLVYSREFIGRSLASIEEARIKKLTRLEKQNLVFKATKSKL